MWRSTSQSTTDTSPSAPPDSRRSWAVPALAVALTAAMALLGGCASSAGDEAAPAADRAGTGQTEDGNSGATGVGQSGAQDFGRFRGLVEEGKLPDPSTLSSVGFFNEHKFQLPQPDCGEDVCLHGMFGVQGNMIDGSNCTMVAVGFNTSLSPSDFERPPLNLAIAVDVSGSMSGTPLSSVKSGLEKMAGQLGPQDRVSIVAYSNKAQVVVESTPGGDPDRSKFLEAVRELEADGSTNIYSGLKTAFDLVDQQATDDRQNRVMLLSDGKATAGITKSERIINMGASYAQKSLNLTTIGVGKEFDLELMRKLSHNGAGNFYFLEDPAAVKEVFVEEVSTFLVPLAEQVNIHFEGTQAYQFRAAYGTRNWTGNERSATVQIPALFMASRTSDEDTGPGGGRRGGGGIMLFELVPTTNTNVLQSTPPGSKVGDLTMTYREPDSGKMIKQTTTIENPLEPNAAPEQGEFSTETVEKAFVALNIFAGWRMATDRAKRGAAGAALNILEPLHENVVDWLEEHDDEDIKADREIMVQLMQIIADRSPEAEIRTGSAERDQQRIDQARPPPSPWPRD